MVFLSGDVHRAEISAQPLADWEIYDLTSSGLSAKTYPAKPNIYRVSPVVTVNHFATLEVSEFENELQLQALIYDAMGNTLVSKEIPLQQE